MMSHRVYSFSSGWLHLKTAFGMEWNRTTWFKFIDHHGTGLHL